MKLLELIQSEETQAIFAKGNAALVRDPDGDEVILHLSKAGRGVAMQYRDPNISATFEQVTADDGWEYVRKVLVRGDVMYILGNSSKGDTDHGN